MEACPGEGHGRKEGQGKSKGGKVGKIKFERAVELLICLGKTNARTMSLEDLSKTLSNIHSVAEEDMNVGEESSSLQKLLVKLRNWYKDGVKIKVVKEPKVKVQEVTTGQWGREKPSGERTGTGNVTGPSYSLTGGVENEVQACR